MSAQAATVIRCEGCGDRAGADLPAARAGFCESCAIFSRYAGNPAECVELQKLFRQRQRPGRPPQQFYRLAERFGDPGMPIAICGKCGNAYQGPFEYCSIMCAWVAMVE